MRHASWCLVVVLGLWIKSGYFELRMRKTWWSFAVVGE
jgi:hypothetical protein